MYRTYLSLKSRARFLGIKFDDFFWTDEDVKILEKYYLEEGQKCFDRIPNRSHAACRTKVNKLCIVRRMGEYSVEENEILKQYYPIEGPSCHLRLNGRSESSVRNQVKKLGIKMLHRPTGDVWTDDEISILTKYYPIEGSNITERLPGRSRETIKRYARLNGLKYVGGSKLKGTTHKSYTATKKVQCVETGEVFESIASTGLRHIGECCKNPNLTSGGYHWKYIEE